MIKEQHFLMIVLLLILFLIFIVNFWHTGQFTIRKKPTKCLTTVVTMFFPLKTNKKHSNNVDVWNKNMLESVDAPLVVFTVPQYQSFVANSRQNKTTTVHLYKDVWQLVRELELKRNKTYVNSYLNEQPKKYIRSAFNDPNAYATWNMKAYITNKVATSNPFDSEFFIYADMNAWRHGLIPKWPDSDFVEILSKNLKNRMLFGAINAYKGEEINHFSSFIQGGFFAGSSKAIYNFTQEYYKLHDERLDDGLFVGNDQILMNILVFKKKVVNGVQLNTWDQKCSNHSNISNQWFFFTRYLSSKSIYNCNYDHRLLSTFS
jgi:hypothetical protein